MVEWGLLGCFTRFARDALTCRRLMASVRGDARLPLLALPCRRKLAPAGRPADAHRPITNTDQIARVQRNDKNRLCALLADAAITPVVESEWPEPSAQLLPRG
jgi:hypothetical protein